MSSEDDAQQRILRQQHVGRLLLQAHRGFNARAVEKLRAQGYESITLAHIGLLPYIDAEGTRVTTLAEEAGMTKQGMGQLVGDLERQGYLRRTVDPNDRRAALVQFTSAGRGLLNDAVAITQEIESEYTAILGEESMHTLRQSLRALVDHERRRDEG